MTEMQTLRLRSKIARRKAIFAGLLYVFGSLGLAIASCLPLVAGIIVTPGYGEFGLTNFWRPIAYVLSNLKVVIGNPGEHIRALAAALLFAWQLAFSFVNALLAISKLDHLCMKGNRRAGYNQNKIAVDSLGKIFSRSFATLVIHTAVLALLYPTQNAKFTTLAIVVAAVFVVIHFVAGAIAGTISKFTIRDEIAEYPRKHVMWSPILRNAAQLLALGAMAFLLKDFCLTAATKLLESSSLVGELKAAMQGTTGLIKTGLFVCFFIGALCLFRHVIFPTEFYLCEKTKTRSFVRFITFGLTAVLFVLSGVCIVRDIVSASFSLATVWASICAHLKVMLAFSVSCGLFIVECAMKNEPQLKACYKPVPVVEEEPVQEVSVVYEPVEEEPEPEASIVYDTADVEPVKVMESTSAPATQSVQDTEPNAIFFYDEAEEGPVKIAEPVKQEAPKSAPAPVAVEEEMPNAIFFYDEAEEEPVKAVEPAKQEAPKAEPAPAAAPAPRVEEEMPNAIFFYDEAEDEPVKVAEPAKQEAPKAEPAPAATPAPVVEEEMPNAIFFYDEAEEEPVKAVEPAKQEAPKAEPAPAAAPAPVVEEEMPNAIFFYDEAEDEPVKAVEPAKQEAPKAEPAPAAAPAPVVEEEMPNAIFFYDEAEEEPVKAVEPAKQETPKASEPAPAAAPAPVVEEELPNALFMYGGDEEEPEEERDDMLVAYDTHPEDPDEMMLGYDVAPEYEGGLMSINQPESSPYIDTSKQERARKQKQEAADKAKAVREKWVAKGKSAREKKNSKQ